MRFELLELGKTTTTHVCSFVLTQDVSTALEHRNLASVNAWENKYDPKSDTQKAVPACSV